VQFTLPFNNLNDQLSPTRCETSTPTQLTCYTCRVDDDQQKRGIKPTDWAGALGKAMDGWPGEKWVDVRKAAVRTIMQKRLAYCAQIKCDGVDPGERL